MKLMALVSSFRWGIVILWMCEQEHELANRSKKKYSKNIHFMSHGIFLDKMVTCQSIPWHKNCNMLT